MSYLNNKKVLVTGASGFLGKHLMGELHSRGIEARALSGKHVCDLRNSADTERYFQSFRPDVVFHLAAVVGGIGANQLRPADFFIDNALMGASVLSACRNSSVQKLVIIGTTCSYPKFCEIPFTEESLWSGYPEETNAPYGIAKRALMIGAEALLAQYGVKVANLIPTNLYGPGDNFNVKSSHVIPALIRKMHGAKDWVELWGSGEPTRDFLYVKDAAKWIVDAAEVIENGKPINFGSGVEISIKELAILIAQVTGFQGQITWNTSKPDGQPRRALDTSKAEKDLGSHSRTPFIVGLAETYEYYKSTLGNAK